MALSIAPSYLSGLPEALHLQARDKLIDLHADAAEARDQVKALESDRSGRRKEPTCAGSFSEFVLPLTRGEICASGSATVSR